MKRREILRLAALGSGTAVFSPLAASLLSGCEGAATDSLENYQPELFNSDQYEQVHDLVDIIIPRTSSPSASDVMVDATIDQMVNRTYSAEARQAYLDDFSKFSEWLNNQEYPNSTDEEKSDILLRLESAEGSIPETVLRGYRHFKQQVIAYYLSSEAIAENELNYLPVPGAYEPCIKLEDVGGKKWAI